MHIRPSHRSASLQRRLSWLLWLALLLPMAQAAATWHGYSHGLQKLAGQHDEPKAAALDHCERCLAAAVVGGAALPSVAPVLPLSFAQAAVPALVAVANWPARAVLAYRSRAPPFSLH